MAADNAPLPDAGKVYTEEQEQAYRRRWNADAGRRDVNEEMVQQIHADSQNVSVLQTLQVRKLWEETVQKRYLQNLLKADGLTQRLSEKNATFCDSDEATIFLGELMETGNATAMLPEERALAVPVLWTYRRPFTMEHFARSLTLNDPEGMQHPVLSPFLQEEAQYALLRHIPGVFEWTNILHKRYNRRIAIEEAREITMGDVLREADAAGNGADVRAAYGAYQDAFNNALTYLDKFGCTPIPEMFKETRISEDLPISYALVGRADETILPLALIQWMCNKHNDFVQNIDTVLLLRQKESQRYAGSNRTMPSSLFTRSHALRYHLDLVDGFVAKQCVTFSAAGDLQYDFAKAEDWLLDRFFTSKPVIDVELREFEFPGDKLTTNRELLQGKINQVPLTPDVEEAIRAELSTPARAARCLRAAEMCVSFVTASSVGLHASMATKSLDSYIRDTLLIDSDTLQSRVVSKEIQMRHLDALCELLDELANPDPFAKVNPFFKSPLTKADTAKLEAACRNEEFRLGLTVLVPTMLKYIKTRVRTANETKAPIADWLCVAETDDMEMIMEFAWWDQFPENIPMKYIVATYEFLATKA